jgi:hypothetical protein
MTLKSLKRKIAKAAFDGNGESAGSRFSEAMAGMTRGGWYWSFATDEISIVCPHRPAAEVD